MGIRNLNAVNLQNNWKFYAISIRLPRQSADWRAMTGFFDRLKGRVSHCEKRPFLCALLLQNDPVFLPLRHIAHNRRLRDGVLQFMQAIFRVGGVHSH